MIRVAARPPFDAPGLLRFLELRAVPGVEAVAGPTYRRDGVELTIDGGGITVVRGGRRAAERATRLLDLDADPVVIGDALHADPVLAPLVDANPGLRVPGAWDGFELALRAIVGQQVTLAAARTLLARIVRRCGGGDFPTPEALLDADLDGIGMPGARVRTLRVLAEAVASRAVALDGSMPATEVTPALLALPGIGPWTASYVAMRALRDPDAFPLGDVGLRNAAARLGLPVEPKALAARAEGWRPWRSYAVVHLWHSLA